ncbi:MAG: hypothetical protein AAGI44_09965 [Pseudomonadota bacterium]
MDVIDARREIYRSEVMGETLFRVARLLTLSADRREKWKRLEALETQTKHRYLEHIGQMVLPPTGARLQGVLYGLLFAAMPWKSAMKMLVEGTAPYMDTFEQLLEHSPEDEKSFYQYVVAHEKAIVSFAAGELAGNDDAITDVVTLLEPPPA